MITVSVTEKHINAGKRRDNWKCPICLALWDATGTKWVVEDSSCYPLTNRNLFIPLPPRVITFIAEFDATGHGKPFSFELQIGDEL